MTEEVTEIMPTPEVNQPSATTPAATPEGGQRNRVLEMLEKFLQKLNPLAPPSEKLSQARNQMNKQPETKSPKMPPTPQTDQSS